MSQASEVTDGNGDTVRVGTTGTIGSLMTQELDSIRRTTPQSSQFSLKQPQDPSISVPCGSSLTKTHTSKSLPSKPRGKPGKKGRSYIVEVVDITCSNPMSTRVKKAGFSKLSESAA